jgi:hypothetical protein
MNRGDFFLMALQSYLLNRLRDPELVVNVLDEASTLPEEIYAEESRLGKAAIDFAKYKLGGKKPKWLESWEEGQKNRVRITLSASIASEFWRTAQNAMAESLSHPTPEGGLSSFPREMIDLVMGRQRGVVVSRATSTAFAAWVQTIPGGDQEPFEYEQLP